MAQQINILHNYGGKPTNEQRILPGIYNVGDKRLFGIEDYLVENGHAKFIIKALRKQRGRPAKTQEDKL